MLEKLLIAIIPALCALAGVGVTLWFNRDQKHREYLFTRKFEAYSAYIAALLEFSIAAGTVTTTLVYTLKAFVAVEKEAVKCGILMSKALQDDITARIGRGHILTEQYIHNVDGGADPAKMRRELEVGFGMMVREIEPLIGLLQADLGLPKLGQISGQKV